MVISLWYWFMSYLSPQFIPVVPRAVSLVRTSSACCCTLVLSGIGGRLDPHHLRCSACLGQLFVVRDVVSLCSFRCKCQSFQMALRSLSSSPLYLDSRSQQSPSWKQLFVCRLPLYRPSQAFSKPLPLLASSWAPVGVHSLCRSGHTHTVDVPSPPHCPTAGVQDLWVPAWLQPHRNPIFIHKNRSYDLLLPLNTIRSFSYRQIADFDSLKRKHSLSDFV